MRAVVAVHRGRYQPLNAGEAIACRMLAACSLSASRIDQLLQQHRLRMAVAARTPNSRSFWLPEVGQGHAV